jgi:probable phosphoglycerate mutase
VLLRHGETDWNREGRAQGHTDVSINAAGHAQAAAVAPVLAAMRPVRLWSSDLARAMETAEHVARATGLEVEPDKRLREYDVGARAGLTLDEFAQTHPDDYAAWVSGRRASLVTDEETTEQVVERIVPALEDCLAALGPGETGVVVLHGACLRVGLVAMVGLPWQQARALHGVANCGWSVLVTDAEGGRTRLWSYNERVDPGPEQDFVTDAPVG